MKEKTTKMSDISIQESDILLALSEHSFSTQRELAAYTGHALGMVNKNLRSLADKGYIGISEDRRQFVTEKVKQIIDDRSPHNAIILAAGFGMRMVPINMETPKALLTVNGEKLIERIIRQLNAVGISDIHVVVGFMKEKFEYLIDRYGVDLIVNSEYAKKNNISSLALATKYIGNTYIVPSDIWCDANPFSQHELYPWYMVSDEIDDASDVRVNRKNELVRVGEASGNAMIGISYLCDNVSAEVKDRIRILSEDPAYDGKFWEESLYGKKEDGEDPGRMIADARVVHSTEVVEINTYEQLRDLDDESGELHSEAIDTIAGVFHVDASDVTDIGVLKKGMTNRSFLFSVGENRYIMRVPGEGTDRLINRRDEADVYKAIAGKGLCDDPVYINPDNGFKITEYLPDVRVCDSSDEGDVTRCMKKLRKFHSMHLEVGHTFDIFGQIDFYRSLWGDHISMYEDHDDVTRNVFALRKYIDDQPKNWSLTHIDAVPDNFLFYKSDGSDEERLQLIDWEYAGMQDTDVDIAMFCIYAMYDKKEADHLIDIYCDGKCPDDRRTKIYCYIAACGLLWSNWCEYKSQLGVEFGEYSLRQYRYAKDYYRYAAERIGE